MQKKYKNNRFSIITKCIGWFAGTSLLCVTPQAQAHDNSFVQGSYAFTLNMAESIEELETSYSMGYDVRWVSFRSRIFAITGEYNSANSTQYKRIAYQQTRVGFQYYPFALGVDFQDSYESVVTTYESFVKPYIGANVGFGRFLLKPLSSEATDGFEQSVDHVIVGGALGTHLQFGRRFAADLAADTGFVLSNSSITLSGLLVRVRAGLMMAM